MLVRPHPIAPAAVAAVAVAGAIAGCGGSYHPPHCLPSLQRCERTSDGVPVPVWWFIAAGKVQHRATPSSTGAHPSLAEERQAGRPDSGGSDGEHGGGGEHGEGGDHHVPEPHVHVP